MGMIDHWHPVVRSRNLGGGPVLARVAGQNIASRQDAQYFVDWIEQMLRVVAARNRYATVENRREVETLFRRAQSQFRKMADAK